MRQPRPQVRSHSSSGTATSAEEMLARALLLLRQGSCSLTACMPLGFALGSRSTNSCLARVSWFLVSDVHDCWICWCHQHSRGSLEISEPTDGILA